ncbi:MAG: response regulator [Chitinophaga sp.]|uniref:hybrid sensor histidine kinase/response regulator transcription factor n=1 Tax=Chitinophaga sp. TaxID=1869181 RepID=UPI001AFE99B9|nr:hybrid sensor histidine kinase/response regulator transcription factor [Chitinophaga sp.]MBO9732425.1 response regulator [Chitinophaga sp.]
MKRGGLLVAAMLYVAVTFASQVNFVSLNNTYALAIREMASVCKDADGFIWASSRMGVLRVAEPDCRIYRLPYVSADVISLKLMYGAGMLVAYSNNGQLFRFNKRMDKFELLIDLRGPLKTGHLSVNNAVIDESGAIWVASSMGLHRFYEGKLRAIGREADEMSRVAISGSGLLAVVRGNALYTVDRRTCEQQYICGNIPKNTSALVYDKISNKLWIGTFADGLMYYDFSVKSTAKKVNVDLPRQPILAIAFNTDATMLLGMDGQGIWELSRSGEKILHHYKEDMNDPESLKGNGVYDIFCDSGRIWISTLTGGLSYFEQHPPGAVHIVHQINSKNSLVNNHVNSVLQDHLGNLWFATNNGISRWNEKTDKWQTFYADKKEAVGPFLVLAEDSTGKIWAGTYGAGVYVLDPATGRELAHYAKEKGSDLPFNNYVFDIYVDSNKDIWYGGGLGNIVRYVTAENSFKKYEYQPVSAFAELSNHQLLMGCTYGLGVMDKHNGDKQIIVDGFLVSDIVYHKNKVWLATAGNGVLSYDMGDKSMRHFNMNNGLPSDYVNSIMVADSFIWAGTEGGIAKLDLQRQQVQTFAHISPLYRLACNRNASTILKDGRILIGTNNGAVLFPPDITQPNASNGRIFLQDLTIAGRSVHDSLSPLKNIDLSTLATLQLNYLQHDFSFELVILDEGVSRSAIEWMLEGWDKDWNKPGEGRKINYSNVAPGEYKLKIHLLANGVIVAEKIIDLRIIPPFWKRWWFYSAVLLLLVTVTYFALRLYIDKLQRRHTADKIRFFTNTAHEMRNALTLVKAPIEELKKEIYSEKGHQHLQLATEQIKELTTTASRLLDFQKVDAGKEKVNFSTVDIVQLIAARKALFDAWAAQEDIVIRFDTDVSDYTSAVDVLMIEKVIDNLVSNAIKYAYRNSTVLLVFSGTPKSWTLEVTNKGIGIGRKAQRSIFREFYRSENAVNARITGSGIGLLLTKSYVKLHRGEISFASQENAGAFFKIEIPYNEIASAPDLTPPRQELIHEIPPAPLCSDVDAPEPLSKLRIFITEDNEKLRAFLLTALQTEFQVFTANNGQEAWPLIRKELPDLVISDILMPEMNGHELCRLIKATFETSHIPLILLSALNSQTDQLYGLGLGADDYLTKPFDIPLLVQKIKTIVRNRTVIREKALRLIQPENNIPILQNEHNDKFVKQAVMVVRDNLANAAFGKEEFAAAMFVSSSLLYKKLKSLTGQSPVDFIKSIRLNHALGLLQSRQHSVMDISELCGFSSVSYFSTSFKKFYGKSPADV